MNFQRPFGVISTALRYFVLICALRHSRAAQCSLREGRRSETEELVMSTEVGTSHESKPRHSPLGIHKPVFGHTRNLPIIVRLAGGLESRSDRNRIFCNTQNSKPEEDYTKKHVRFGAGELLQKQGKETPGPQGRQLRVILVFQSVGFRFSN